MPKRNPATAERGPLGAAEPRRKRKKLQTSFLPMQTRRQRLGAAGHPSTSTPVHSDAPPPVIGPSPAHTSPATSFRPHLGTSRAGEQPTPTLHPSSPTPAGDRTVDPPSQEANLTGQDTLTSQVSTLTSQVAKLSSVLYPAQHPGPVAPSRAIKGRTAAKKMLQQQCKTIGCKHCSWTGRSGLGYEKHITRHHSDIPGILWLAPRGIFPPTGPQGATSTFTSDSSSSPES